MYHLRPLMTQLAVGPAARPWWRYSRRRSRPRAGSVMAKADLICPSSWGWSHRSVCSARAVDDHGVAVDVRRRIAVGRLLGQRMWAPSARPAGRSRRTTEGRTVDRDGGRTGSTTRPPWPRPPRLVDHRRPPRSAVSALAAAQVGLGRDDPIGR